ncbi:hypothetical protein KBD75_01975 [Candidatus Woesebacteria bacterium]|nr:hypothetical protein [Candidatus Woesebacteria bacterium]
MRASREQDVRYLEMMGKALNDDYRVEGLRVAIEALVGFKLNGGGSFLTESWKPEKYPGGSLISKMHSLRKKEVLPNRRVIDQAKIPDRRYFKRLTLDVASKLGVIKVDQLSAPSYAFLKVWQLLLPNEDFRAREMIGDPQTCAKHISSMLSLGHVLSSDSDTPAVVGRRKYNNRVDIINFWKDSGGFDGYNYLIFPKDHKNEYGEMTNLRSLVQSGYLEYGLGGNSVIPNQTELNEQIKMVGKPKNLGQWLMHTARTIRAMVMNGIPVSQLDVESFLNRLASLDSLKDGDQIGFEEASQVVANLLVADEHAAKLTNKMISMLGMERYLGKAKYGEVVSGMQEAELQLWGSAEQGSGRRKGKYTSFGDLAKKVAKYMVVPMEVFYDLVPPPAEREFVEASVVGGDNNDLQQVYRNAIPAVEAALQIMRTEGGFGEYKSLDRLHAYLLAETGIQYVVPSYLDDELWKIFS